MAITYQNDTVASYSAGWTGQAQGANYNADEHYSNTSAATCTFTFTGLTNGVSYCLALAWRASSGNSATSGWAAASGGNTASGTFNGKVAAKACVTSTVPFQALAILTASGTTATLVLTVPAGAEYLVIDAAAIGPPADFTGIFAVTDGAWSTAGTWAPPAVPAGTATVTVSCNLTVSDARTVGSASFTTGGTPAITFTAGSLTLATGGSLVVSGDILHSAASPVTMAAGTTLTFKPPSAQQCKWNQTTNSESLIVCNGSSGSHCTVQTDKSLGGLATYMTVGAATNQGIITASYTDFLDFGDTSHVGVVTRADNSGSHAVSITDCTFTRCSYSGLFGPATSWDGNLTFQRVKFTSSTLLTLNGNGSSCAAFTFGNNRTSGTRLIDLCAFDAKVSNGDVRQCKVTHCVIQGEWLSLGNSAWPDETYYDGNLIYSTGNMFSAYGSLKNCYIFNLTNPNPHYWNFATTVTNPSTLNCIFEATPQSAGDSGDIIGMPIIGSAGTFTVTGCLVLNDVNSRSAGKLSFYNSGGSSTSCQAVVEHNTVYSRNLVDVAVWGMNETAGATAGIVRSLQANLVWSDASGSGVSNYIAADKLNGSNQATDGITLSDYNATWNGSSGTNLYNVSTSQGSVLGYNNLKITLNSAYPNAQIGIHDISLNASGGPNFVDSTRGLGTWGATQGGDGTAAGAVAILAANPALIGQAGSGLLAWVRAGYRPRNTALAAASYPTDASTADASGNAWAGAHPDIGAMAMATTIAGNPYYIQAAHDGGFFGG